MGWEIFWTLFLVFANGFFVAAEFAIVKVRASQIEIKLKTGSQVAQVAKHITNHLDGYLAATQLGITISSLALGWVGEAVMTDIVGSIFGWFDVELTGTVAKIWDMFWLSVSLPFFISSSVSWRPNPWLFSALWQRP